jgi:D-xylose transport system permease protein
MSDIEQETAPVEGVLLAEAQEKTFGDYVSDRFRRMRAGDLGSLPIILGLAVIAIIFGIASDGLFFNARNFVNLLLQVAPLTTIAIGVVFVLLIAEIDLSIGFVSGLGAVIMTLLVLPSVEGQPLPWFLAILVALLATTTIGFMQGFIITRAGVPSFIVTLAGLLIWSGVVLILTTETTTIGTIVIQDTVILGVANEFLPPLGGYVLWAVTMGLYVVLQITGRRAMLRRNLPVRPTSVLALQIIGLAVITGFAVWYANKDRGVPVVSVIILILLVFWTFIASRTRFGRYIYAVGGNPEAARRAGINVDRIRIMAFMISSFMAGVGGVILASRLRSVDTGVGGGNLLLNVIAAAVIGGTSLFGGVGFVMSALLGGLVIASVENGMGLLGLPSGVKFVVNGLVLLAAVLVDALVRRRRERSGMM